MLPAALAVSQIRAFNPKQDASWLHRLWLSTMHARWSLSLDSMQKVLADARSLLVAERNGVRLGFCAADYASTGDAGLLILLVEPACQRQGIGSALVSRLKRILRTKQVRTLHLGACSNGTYFWPGLPAENELALPFFLKHGWQKEEACADLVQELDSFKTPVWVSDRIRHSNAVFQLANTELRPEIAAFERGNFPAWASFVDNEFAESGDRNILVAQAKNGAVVGTVLMKVGVTNHWARESGTQVGSLNILGIAPGSQRQGIGLALTACAMEILQERGCSRCYIQWTGLNEWYGKLGATVWAEYRMASTLLG